MMSRFLVAIACVGSLGFAIPTPSFAIVPVDKSFKMRGQLDVVDSNGNEFICEVKMMGKISKIGIATISSAIFGPENKTCSGPPVATNLPWTMKDYTQSGYTIKKVGIKGGGIEPCGPAVVGAGAGSRGEIILSGYAIGSKCHVKHGVLQSKPEISP